MGFNDPSSQSIGLPLYIMAEKLSIVPGHGPNFLIFILEWFVLLHEACLKDHDNYIVVKN